MLGEAAVCRPDKATPTADEVMADPRDAMYLSGWPRHGDDGLVAEQDGPGRPHRRQPKRWREIHRGGGKRASVLVRPRSAAMPSRVTRWPPVRGATRVLGAFCRQSEQNAPRRAGH